MSLILAVAITAPALAVALFIGADGATVIAVLVPAFLIWFVGGGLRRARAARRMPSPH